ncbi:ABZJ_00895 family protein [Ciceribacter ferrooxidans]|uniref:Transmembrane protein n=1 Tax=Ciceribacter ferrooxidans TaxID=2509717 RepID=A0A4Q2T0W5_9HYPH|nr:ABZJ_00895 family protein [Ciceribacter ferrooxidans]RYC12032.1 hypothetical protein EUU22_13290 [Ciceribacter ferrooxidans]
MPSFIVPLAIRYFFVSLAITIAGMVAVALLLAYNVVDDIGSSLSFAVTYASGVWAGTYFRKQEDRMAEWGECWRISAVLLVPQFLLEILHGAFSYVLTGSLFGQLASDPGILIGTIVFGLAFGALIAWVVTATAFRIGSKAARKPKKA